MAHLDLSKYRLLNDTLREMMSESKKSHAYRNGQLHFSLGAICEGPPVDANQPSSCAYFMSGLPTPELGTIPRNEMVEELKNDDQKEIKQRRDFGFVDGKTVARFKLPKFFVSLAGCSARHVDFPLINTRHLSLSQLATEVFKDPALKDLAFTLSGGDLINDWIREFSHQEDIRKNLASSQPVLTAFHS